VYSHTSRAFSNTLSRRRSSGGVNMWTGRDS
jgi:hypothetical protein